MPDGVIGAPLINAAELETALNMTDNRHWQFIERAATLEVSSSELMRRLCLHWPLSQTDSVLSRMGRIIDWHQEQLEQLKRQRPAANPNIIGVRKL